MLKSISIKFKYLVHIALRIKSIFPTINSQPLNSNEFAKHLRLHLIDSVERVAVEEGEMVKE